MNDPDRRDGIWRGAALVAATYVYFLLFAEFAFIELARPVAGDGAGLRLVMGGLGAGGAAGSVLAARFFQRARWGARLAGWLLGCAVAAGGAAGARGLGAAGLALAGAGVGVSLGGATVTLATGLRAIVGRRRLGLAAGLGTGAAYAFCNVPVVFEASPVAQSFCAIVAVLAGAWIAGPLGATEEFVAERRGPGGWVLVFLALVWMDSAAFYIIQHTEVLKASAWRGAWTLGGNAAAHFVAAVIGGWLLDRGRAGWVTAAAAVSLAAACRWIGNEGAEILYVAGVSLYSAALVYVPARAGEPRTAALIYAVAGWGGSALGIGMAQDLHGVPDWFGVVALGAVAGGLWWMRGASGGARVALLALAGGLAAIASPSDLRADEAAILRGREVYIAEGCIHCHSQYVRPGTKDVVRWGPARPLEELLREKPPLFGNRRQGPDLLNVGNRRSREWNRAHLLSPRELSPGSRMPSYAGRFSEGGERGEDLLDYLDSLGAGTDAARAEEIAGWRPVPEARVDPALGAAWFARSCVQCHGPEGRGDGPLAERFSSRPADLARATIMDELSLARVIKFGRPGTAMAGHESFDDETVVSLARYVRGLQESSAAHMTIR